ncbi:MAG: molybdenum cofactor guanylyltransferase [Gemmatimonadaceae bacterium]|nr:molybdenum cofactor guanylyltransferase [Gemmatimonadaceae bacterium]
MTRVPQSRCGVLLAGGQSTRFGGRPKGLSTLGGARLADHALKALSAACDEVVVAANAPEAEAWFPGARIVRDDTPGLGALGALRTALVAGAGRTVIVCAWDMPFVDATLLSTLATAVEAGASCCVPQHEDGRLEPLCAAYGPACAAAVERLLESGERAAHALPDAMGGTRWTFESREDDSTSPFFNVNTPAELVIAARRLTVAQPAP